MRALVTGGAGFVGSHIADALVARGDAVVIVDDLATGDRTNLAPTADLRVADVSDERALGGALAGERFDAVVHCASRTKVVESMAKPELYRRVIVDGTRNTIAAAGKAGAKVFVHLSTGGAIYGETRVCADEAVPTDPPSNYGRLKMEAEALVAASGLRAVNLRLANVYGPRQRRDLEGGVIAIFLGCWQRQEPLTLFGDGSYERDYVYVADITAAVRAALDGTQAGIYNIGTGVATSVNALVTALGELLGPPPGITRAPARPVELQRSCLDAAKAAREALWRPRTTLAEGLRRTAVPGA